MTILAHSSSYIKNYNYILKSLLKLYSLNIVNLQGVLFDSVAANKCDYLILPIENYSVEFHAFISDPRNNDVKILICVDDNKANDEAVIHILSQISRQVVCIMPNRLDIQNNNIQFITYQNLINKDIIHIQDNNQKNNKILCILPNSTEKLSIIKPYLFPNTMLPIIMINNPSIEYDQNIGICFDEDINEMLNTCESVIDLSESYTSEISHLQVKSHDISDLSRSFAEGPKIIKLTKIDDSDTIVSKLQLLG